MAQKGWRQDEREYLIKCNASCGGNGDKLVAEFRRAWPTRTSQAIDSELRRLIAAGKIRGRPPQVASYDERYRVAIGTAKKPDGRPGQWVTPEAAGERVGRSARWVVTEATAGNIRKRNDGKGGQLYSLGDAVRLARHIDNKNRAPAPRVPDLLDAAVVPAGIYEDQATGVKFYEWTVKIAVASTWVEDGFNLTAERAHRMVAHHLSYANGGEIRTSIVTAPSRDAIAREQGYNGAEDPRFHD